MRALVRAAGITSKHRTRTGVVATKVGALAFGVGLTMLAGAFFAGPALAQQGALPQGVVMDHGDDHSDDPPACGPMPLPPCDDDPTPPPPTTPTDPTDPPVDPPTDTPPTAKPSNEKPKPPADGGNGGGGGDQGGNSGGGGGGTNEGPQLPATGAEAGLLAGLGAALVGGGAALVVLARRRRAALATSAGSDDKS